MPGTLGGTYAPVHALGSTFNLGSAFGGLTTHEVAWPAPQPFDANGNLLLATWIITNMGAPVPPGTKLTVTGWGGPPVPPCPGVPLVSDANFDITCQECGEMRVNGGPSCTVAVEERTWTGVRNLFR
jgi:hypothetical protein